MSQWRVGRQVPINVYEDARPVCQCHNPEDAARIVAAMNQPGMMEELKASTDELRRLISEARAARLKGYA